MATVKVGDRDLEVKECTLGLWKRQVRVFQQEAQNAKTLEDVGDRAVDLMLAFVGHNEGVTREWLEDNFPLSSTSMVNQVLRASGLEMKDSQPGEAVSQ